MKLSSNRSLLNWIIILVSFIIVSLILWNTYRFFQKFKDEERVKMENFSKAQIELTKTQDLDGNISELPLKIIQSNTTPPMIIVDSKGFFQSNNIDLEGENNQEYLKKLAKKYKFENRIFTFDEDRNWIPAVIDNPVISLAYQIKYDL